MLKTPSKAILIS